MLSFLARSAGLSSSDACHAGPAVDKPGTEGTEAANAKAAKPTRKERLRAKKAAKRAERAAASDDEDLGAVRCAPRAGKGPLL